MRCAGPSSIAERLARNIGVAKAGTSMQPPNGGAQAFRSLHDRRGSVISVSAGLNCRPPRCAIIGEVSYVASGFSSTFDAPDAFSEGARASMRAANESC